MCELRKILGGLTLLGFLFLSSGCCVTQYFHKRETQYLGCCEAPALQVPCSMSRANIGSDYAIPPVAGPKPCQPVCIIPPGK